MIKAVLTSPGHPEYGEVTVPFPIPDVDYDHAMELLGGLLEQVLSGELPNQREVLLERINGI